MRLPIQVIRLVLSESLNVPKRGVGPTSLNKLHQFANIHDWSLLETAQNADLANISGKAGAELKSFR